MKIYYNSKFCSDYTAHFFVITISLFLLFPIGAGAGNLKKHFHFGLKTNKNDILNRLTDEDIIKKNEDEIHLSNKFVPDDLRDIFSTLTLGFYESRLYLIGLSAELKEKKIKSSGDINVIVKKIESFLFTNGIVSQKEESGTSGFKAISFFCRTDSDAEINLYATANSIQLFITDYDLSAIENMSEFSTGFKNSKKILGLNFGLKKVEVKKRFSDKKIALIKEDNNTLIYDSPLINYPDVGHVVLLFYYNILISQKIYFDTNTSNINYYYDRFNRVADQLVKNYGPVWEVKDDLSEIEDSNKMSAVKFGYGKIYTKWSFLKYCPDKIYLLGEDVPEMTRKKCQSLEIMLYFGGSDNTINFYLDYSLESFYKEMIEKVSRDMSGNL